MAVVAPTTTNIFMDEFCYLIHAQKKQCKYLVHILSGSNFNSGATILMLPNIILSSRSTRKQTVGGLDFIDQLQSRLIRHNNQKKYFDSILKVIGSVVEWSAISTTNVAIPSSNPVVGSIL